MRVDRVSAPRRAANAPSGCAFPVSAAAAKRRERAAPPFQTRRVPRRIARAAYLSAASGGPGRVASAAPAPTRYSGRGNTRMAPSLVLRLVASAEPYSTRCSSGRLAPRSAAPRGAAARRPRIRASASVAPRGGDEQLGDVGEEPRVEVFGARRRDGRGVRLDDGDKEVVHLLARPGRARRDAPSRDGAAQSPAARAATRSDTALQRRRVPATPRPLRRRVPRRFPRPPSRAARAAPPRRRRRGTGRTARRRPARAALGASTPRGTPPAAGRTSPRTRITRLTHLTRGWDRSRGLVVLRKNRRLTFRPRRDARPPKSSRSRS